MHIDQFIEEISFSELENLSIGMEGRVNLGSQNKKKLEVVINQGLRALGSRFELLKKEVVIVSKEGQTLYPLISCHSIKHGNHPNKFIDDTCEEPFSDDLVKILEVRDVMGNRHPLNEGEKPGSFYTPTWNTLQIPVPLDGAPYYIQYQALPPKLSVECCGPKEIMLPPVLEEALLAFVAGKIYSNMNGEANKATGRELLALFEEKCLLAFDRDMASESQVEQHTKFQQRGFI